MKLIQYILVFLIPICGHAQEPDIYPPNWWVNMQNPNLQIMIHSKDIGKNNVFQIDYPAVQLSKIIKTDNPNYVFIDLIIKPEARPGFLSIKTDAGKEIKYELRARRKAKGIEFAQGVNTKDLIYLIMPDRFSNGDERNDQIPGMRDQSLNRDTIYNRHGGDLKGISNHLNYLNDLGVTTLWLNPVWENDMPDRTEHGYAFTNHYKVDARLGGNQAYLDLINAAHNKGMKVIQDAVYNHVGLYHFLVLDPPDNNWLHNWKTYTNTNFKDQVLFDPYASEKDKKQMADGWFTPMMPDLNQGYPMTANFLIQHAIWSVEAFGIDGWRIDTYAYNDLEFMNRCNKALMDEYPAISLFGETWVQGVPNQSYFCNNNYSIPYKSNLPGVTDFQCLWAIIDAMNKDFGWTDGVNKLYTVLAQDFVYADPNKNVIFLDNHDLSRFYSVVNEDLNKYKSALCWLLTARGIPQVYYGDELATTGNTSPSDGYVRLDFPGGWKNDKVNKFLDAGRSEKDKEIFEHFKKLARFRKESSAITSGKFMQYLPNDGLYVYFRYDNAQTIMVAMNTSKTEKEVNPLDYEERTKGFNNFEDILSSDRGKLSNFKIKPYQTVVYEIKP